jgi:FkbM family methyltransferase
MAAHQISVVLDVGANVGQFALRLRGDAGFRGRIESFEPTPSTLEALTVRASGDTLWRVHCVALGSVDQEEELHLFERSDWNSLRRPDEEHMRSAGWSQKGIGSTVVSVRRLDGMWRELVRADDSVLLKADTQGHDMDVLEGAGDFLGFIKVILLEGSVTTFYEDEPPLPMLLERLDALGFAPSGFFPVTRRPTSMALDTVDVCFVRRD